MTKDINIPKISLKAARVNAELNQQEAAELLGIDVSTLIRWEKDPRIVKVVITKLFRKFITIQLIIFFWSQYKLNLLKLIKEKVS